VDLHGDPAEDHLAQQPSTSPTGQPGPARRPLPRTITRALRVSHTRREPVNKPVDLLDRGRLWLPVHQFLVAATRQKFACTSNPSPGTVEAHPAPVTQTMMHSTQRDDAIRRYSRRDAPRGGSAGEVPGTASRLGKARDNPSLRAARPVDPPVDRRLCPPTDAPGVFWRTQNDSMGPTGRGAGVRPGSGCGVVMVPPVAG